MQNAIAAIQQRGWEFQVRGDDFILKPGPVLRHKFGFAAHASFYFYSLEEAGAWARGFGEAIMFSELKKKAPKKKGK